MSFVLQSSSAETWQQIISLIGTKNNSNILTPSYFGYINLYFLKKKKKFIFVNANSDELHTATMNTSTGTTDKR